MGNEKKKGKQPYILWRKSSQETIDIINELSDANVCIIENCNGSVVFKNRRMMKQKHISVERSKAVLNRYKDDTNVVQPSEYENEN